MPPMPALPALITDHLAEVRALCEKYRVKRLTLFGSAVKGTFDPETSDLDFVVEFFADARLGGFDSDYFRLLENLQTLFGRTVDLVERPAIENPYFVKVLALTERPLYESTRAA
jgi:predicted nucleotidyltransferase